MNTAIVYYSQHHGNTKKLLDAIKKSDPSVALIDVTAPTTTDLSTFDRIGFASGIYFTSFAKQALSFAEAHLPDNKDLFCIFSATTGCVGLRKRNCRLVESEGFFW